VSPAWTPFNIGNAVEITTYALSVGTTTLSTIIIVIRILLVSRTPGASNKPRLAAEIITESAALYTISALIFIAFISGNFYYLNYAGVFFAYMAVCSLLFLALHPS
jgi:predicted signal transduction protein with EAL and GGDEF domain